MMKMEYDHRYPTASPLDDRSDRSPVDVPLPAVPIAGPYELEDIVLSDREAAVLHGRFMTEYLPYIPIFESTGPGELYAQSKMLFWTVMVTASLSDETPALYLRLVEAVKRYVMSVAWTNTSRSTHVVQALVILSTWPLPNEKVLDDPSYRYINLARCLGLQLGMHRGKFIYEFSRKQKQIPNAVKWRTRTWVAIYVNEQFLSASLGVPSSMQVDYLVDQACVDHDVLSTDSRAILELAVFYSKMATVMGSSISSPDGLLDAKMRSPTLDILNHSLSQLKKQITVESPYVEIVFLYVQCMLCCFSFLPGTPEEDQPQFVIDAFHAATRLITLMRTLVGKRRITEFPGIIRQASSFAALVLFRLHLAPQFPQQYVESSRHSIVTVHHLYRNVTAAWGDVQNDISRIAKLLESLNYVMITHPYLLTSSRQIISRMRSHLTYSIFYELIWAVHEARRRNTRATRKMQDENVPKPLLGPEKPENIPKVAPLPLFNQITTDEFTTSTFTSPNGTTMTMLVPTANTTGDLIPDRFESSTGQPSHGNGVTVQPQEPERLHSDGAHESLDKESLSGPLGQPYDAPLVDSLLQGIDWMNYEGDDFLGWMPTGGEFSL